MTSRQGLSAFARCSFAAAALLASHKATAVQYVTVKGERVNLRAAPNPESEVVGQVSEPEQLVLQGSVTDPWVKVTPPDSIDLWIFANLVKDGKVTVNNAQVRSGAGLNFNVVGKLQRDESVNIRGKVGDWIKIAPFTTSALWVTNSYVALSAPPPPPPPPPPAPIAPLVVEPQAAPEKPPAPPQPLDDKIIPQEPDAVATKRTVLDSSKPISIPLSESKKPTQPIRRSLFRSPEAETTVGPANVPTSRLRSDAKQSETGAYSGTLALAPNGQHPTRFRLVKFSPDGKPETVCYVLGNNRQLDSLKGNVFTIEGTVYWFNSTTLPTVYAQNILRHQN